MASRNRRLFFALWPDDALRQRLAGIQAGLHGIDGQWVHADDFHITLQFLGSVAPSRMACIDAAASAISVPGFELLVDELGYWGRAGILWAGVSKAPDELRRLVSDLGQSLKQCGFPPERREYRPHVTLVRKASPLESVRLPERIEWKAEDFVLVESRPGGSPPWYQVVDRWPLQ